MAKEVAGGVSEQVLYLSREIDILKRELLAQGEQLNREMLDRKAEVDRLKIEVLALKRLLDEHRPGAAARFEQLYADERQKFDPEFEKSA